MKYWRGYVFAFIAAACTWALTLFASSHVALMDTVYPYFTRLLMDSVAQWSSSAGFCLWQLGVLVFIGAVLVSIVLMFVLRWNPVQWFGWVLAAVSVVNLLNTGLYGLNKYTGSITEDLRMTDTPYSMSDLKDAALYFQEQANTLAGEGQRDENGLAEFADFDTLANQACEGFRVMTYERSASVLAGSRLPVKELGWESHFTHRGITGMTVGLTGEAAVNPQVPDSALPFAMCREMAHRMSIVNSPDGDFAAFLTCEANPDPQFRYSGFMMAYAYCCDALESFDTYAARELLEEITASESDALRADLTAVRDFLKKPLDRADGACTMLVNWYIEKIVLPTKVEETPLFDPTDEEQVDLSGIRAAEEP